MRLLVLCVDPLTGTVSIQATKRAEELEEEDPYAAGKKGPSTVQQQIRVSVCASVHS